MADKYDMIVIGAGSGGLSMALGLHELGFKVLLIDKSDQAIGGECLNSGCVPSKAFIHASKSIRKAFEAKKFGLKIDGQVSLQKVWEYVKRAQDKIRSRENAGFFQNQGLDVVIGTARFAGKNQVEVNGQTYSGKKITIATGSKPRKLKVPGVELVNCYDNENLWNLPSLPSKILFIGAGPINMELGQAFTRLGSQVTMVELANRILIKEAPEISEILFNQSVELGIEFHMNTHISHFLDSNTALLKNQHEQTEISFDAVVVGIGREINHSGLNLETAKIKTDERNRIIVDPYLRTSNRNVYVIGDAAGGPQFSHGAELQATILIKNFLSPFKSKVQYDHFSWVTFTEPEVATFGWSEEQLRQRGKSFEKLVLDFEEDDRAVTSDYQYGRLILFLTKELFQFSDAKLLGGSMIAPNAGEMFQELILARSAGLGIKSLFNKIYPYPTGARVNKTIVLNKYSQSIRPWMTKIMKLIY